MNSRYATISGQLATLCHAPRKPDVFGAQSHGYLVNPPLPERHVRDFEHEHRIVLPEEYRGFLLNVGNGGAGPTYGLFPLGQMDSLRNHKNWREGDGFIGTLSVPFPLIEPWNDLADKPQEDESVTAADPSIETEFDRQIAAWDEKYWDTSRVNGAVPICHLGCAYRQWIVITGPERGNIWCDDRADDGGLYPLEGKGRTRHSFLDWYCDWLDEAVQKLRELG